MSEATDKLLDLIPVAIAAKLTRGFLPDDSKKKKKKGLFDFGGD